MKLFDSTFGTLERALDLRFKRHAVLSTNVANAETPNYRARELDFSSELIRAVSGPGTSALEKTNPLHMDIEGSEQAHMIYDNQGAVGADGNNVDIDLAMGKIGENSGGFETTATYLQLKLKALRAAARGAGGE